MSVFLLGLWPADWLHHVCLVLFLVQFGYFVAVHSITFVLAQRLHKRLPRDTEKGYPPVTIIKPLAGHSKPHSNIEAFFNLQYPQYEVIFCIQSKSDEVYDVVVKMMADHQDVDTSIYTAPEDMGLNPKVVNMLPGLENAKYEMVWMVDAGFLAFPDTLNDLIHSYQSEPNVGLVHQLPYWVAKPDFASCLNQVFFGTCHSRMHLMATFLNQNCACGISFLTTKSIMNEIGGLRHYSQYIAEDYFISKAIKDKGYRHVVCPLPALQNRDNSTVGELRQRMIRWIRLRTSMVPCPSLLEPLSECMLQGVLGSLCFHYITGVPFYLYICLHILLWMISDFALLKALQNGSLLHLRKLVLAWFFREAIAFPTFIQAVSSRMVMWNNKLYCLGWGGVCTKVEENPVINI